MRKKLIIFFLIFTLCIGINLTSYEGCKKVSASPSKKSTKIARIIPNFPISIRYSMSFRNKRSEIIESYGEPNKTKIDGDFSYDIWEMKDGTKMIAIYDHLVFVHLAKFKSPFTKKDFKNIKLDKTTYKNIKKIDPYMFLVRNGKTAFSEHILTDKILLQINYIKKGNKWLVNEYKFIDIEFPFPDIYKIN